jgi:hypothetical protein
MQNYFDSAISCMSEDEEDLSAFLERFGIAREEFNEVAIELNAYRSIPGTTLKRYLNRVLNSIVEEERPAFLKGIMVGLAVRKAVDAVEEPDLTDEEKKIAFEIEKQRSRL